MTEDIFTTLQKERNAAERRAFEAGTQLAQLVGRYGKDGHVPVAEVREVMRLLIPGETSDQS